MKYYNIQVHNVYYCTKYFDNNNIYIYYIIYIQLYIYIYILYSTVSFFLLATRRLWKDVHNPDSIQPGSLFLKILSMPVQSFA
jgi:hypothetical protein